MNSEASWFDADEHPRLSLILHVFLVILIFMPFVFTALYYWAMSDIGANSFPEPWRALAVGLVAAFVLSIPCAGSAVLAYRFIARCCKAKRNAV
jgi:apolipoprotein N-acyltransferase